MILLQEPAKLPATNDDSPGIPLFCLLDLLLSAILVYSQLYTGFFNPVMFYLDYSLFWGVCKLAEACKCTVSLLINKHVSEGKIKKSLSLESK